MSLSIAKRALFGNKRDIKNLFSQTPIRMSSSYEENVTGSQFIIYEVSYIDNMMLWLWNNSNSPGRHRQMENGYDINISYIKDDWFYAFTRESNIPYMYHIEETNIKL